MRSYLRKPDGRCCPRGWKKACFPVSGVDSLALCNPLVPRVVQRMRGQEILLFYIDLPMLLLTLTPVGQADATTTPKHSRCHAFFWLGHSQWRPVRPNENCERTGSRLLQPRLVFLERLIVSRVRPTSKLQYVLTSDTVYLQSLTLSADGVIVVTCSKLAECL